MIGLVIGLAAFVVLLAALLVIVYRRRTGRGKSVREEYALRCTTLLIALAGDTIYALTSGYTVWDIAAVLLGVDIQEPTGLAIAAKVLMVVVFLAAVSVVRQTYRIWNGPVSRRQHQMDMRMEESSLLLDFCVALLDRFTRAENLSAYRKLEITPDSGEEGYDGDPPWHLEFAAIYTLLSNQAHINPETDWHPQARCFLSTYADGQRIAIYCAETRPDEETVDAFLAYIRQYHTSYLQVIVAVKQGEGEDVQVVRNGQPIRYLFKKNALDNMVDFSGYHSAMDRLYHSHLMQDTPLNIEDVYVEPLCRLGEKGEAVPLEEYIKAWLGEEGNRQLALLGDFGQGKTLFSIHLTWQMLSARTRRIPILIPLRNKSPRNSSEMEIFSYFAARYGISPEALRILNNNGRLLLIFDGFDEMDLIGNDDIRKRHFQSLWKLVRPRSKVLITGRPNYFFSQDELVSALGLQAGGAGIPRCDPLYLQLFTPAQMLRALRCARPSVQAGIRTIIEENVSPSFLDLISRPSHLFLVSQIWEERRIGEKYKNLTSAAIINEFIQNCFERQREKGTADPYFYLSAVEREFFMVGIAVYMYKLGAVSIPQDVFADVVVNLLELFPEKLSQRNPAALNLRGGKALRAFAQADDNSLVAVMNDVRTCGLLVNDTAASGLCFAHKSFFDLLVAKFYLGKELSLHDETMDISRALSRSAAFNPRLRQDFVVRKLLAELIAGQVNLHMNTTDAAGRSLKIFQQCRRVLSYRGFSGSPQGLLLRSAEEIQRGWNGGMSRRRSIKSRVRFGMVYLCMALIAVSFLIKSVQINMQYQGEAARYFEGVRSHVETAGPMVRLSEQVPYLPMVFVCLLTLALIYLLCRRMALSLSGKEGLVLLTWYHACRENGISDQDILGHFSPRYAEAFLALIQGNSLTEIQERLSTAGQRRTRRWRDHSRRNGGSR